MHFGTSLALTIVLSLGGQCALAQDEPVRWHGRDMTVMADSGHRPIAIAMGLNAIDNPKSFTCHSSTGCLVTTSANVQTDTLNGKWLCSYIDGRAARPPCGHIEQDPPILSLQQREKVLLGQHTAETFLNGTQAGGNIVAWEINYTVYEGLQ